VDAKALQHLCGPLAFVGCQGVHICALTMSVPRRPCRWLDEPGVHVSPLVLGYIPGPFLAFLTFLAFALGLRAFSFAITFWRMRTFFDEMLTATVKATVFRALARVRVFVAFFALCTLFTFALATLGLELRVPDNCEYGLLMAVTKAR